MSLPTLKRTPLSSVEASGLMLIRDLIHDRTGIFFEDTALHLMADKLSERLARQPSVSYLDYYYLLKMAPDHASEWRELFNVFSVQETYFWRETDQIRNLVDRMIPDWFARTSAPFTIWCSACATGEEPYSIALALDVAGWGRHPIRICASDASERALEKAGVGLYRERAFRLLPSGLRKRYFHEQAKGWKLDSEIADRVAFSWINLVAEADYDQLPRPQVIFCRNVFIYFSPTSISKVVRAFARRIPKGGVLFVGATESLLRLTDEFELCDLGNCFGYRKTQEPA